MQKYFMLFLSGFCCSVFGMELVENNQSAIGLGISKSAINAMEQNYKEQKFKDLKAKRLQ